MKKICDKCGGAGTLTPEPEIITVRIKGMGGATWYNIGDVFQVIECNDPQFYQVTNANGLFAKMICEVIPPIPEGYRLRRKWGKDEELIGNKDMFLGEEGWKLTERTDCGKQFDDIYITPITPDPSADCLPGFEAVEVSIYQGNLYYKSPECGGLVLEIILREPRWSGRYGYKYMSYGKDQKILWSWRARAYHNAEGDISDVATPSQYVGHEDHNIPVTPDYVEMKKEKP